MENENQSTEKKTPEDLLRETVAALGFSRNLDIMNQIENHLKSGVADFVAKGTFDYRGSPDEKTREMQAELHFRRPNPDGYIFFNKWIGEINDPQKENEKRIQTFYIDQGRGATSKQGFNLLDGRSAYVSYVSEKGPYREWDTLKLNQEKDKYNNYLYDRFYDTYGFDAAIELKKYPIKYTDSYTETDALKGLYRGDSIPVTLTHGDETATGTLRANPKYKELIPSKDLKVFLDLNHIDIPRAQKVSKEQSTSTGSTKEEQTPPSEEPERGQNQSNSRTRRP